ncbi:MAG: 6-pyruvoyl-tetrahydropterin synthase-related protein, partial [bacterium]|nr:6-pyruvoyl-tetrahydropterin synthase-related protein [bacterium]
CRWVPDLGYGYGYPLFNYYPPLPYYTGEFIHLIFGISFLDTVKILFGIGFPLSGIFMYFLAREFWGKTGGFLAGVFYIYAPYHAVDVYVRGAMAEDWALIWFPLIFLAIYKIIKEEKFYWVYLLALSYGLLLLSHNIMSMLFSVASLAWGVLWLVQTRKIKKVFRLIFGVLWGVALAAFFFLPVIVEKQYAHTETMTMGYFNYLAHFATLRQMFIKTEFGWGASVGADDKFPYMIGFFHWIIPLVSLFLAFIFLRKKKADWGRLLAIVFGVAFLFGTAFMAHQRSLPIWIRIPMLEYLQFPWRFLGLVIFFASFSVGSIVIFFKNEKIKILLTLLLIGGLLYSVKGYFQAEKWYNITDKDRLTGEAWQLGLTNGIFDYLPIYAHYPPPGPAPAEPQILEGNATIENLEKGTDWQRFGTNVSSESAKIQFPLYDFPGWEVRIDQRKTTIDHDNFLGLITIDVPQGPHKIEARLTDTPIRKIGNFLTMVALFAFAYVGWKQLRRKK